MEIVLLCFFKLIIFNLIYNLRLRILIVYSTFSACKPSLLLSQPITNNLDQNNKNFNGASFGSLWGQSHQQIESTTAQAYLLMPTLSR